MIKLELRQILKEEIRKVLKEASGKIPGLKIEIDQKTGDMIIHKGKDQWESYSTDAERTNKVELGFWEGQYGIHFGTQYERSIETLSKLYQKIKDDGYKMREGGNIDFLLSEYMDPNSTISKIYNKIGGKLNYTSPYRWKGSLPGISLEVNFEDLLSIADVIYREIPRSYGPFGNY